MIDTLGRIYRGETDIDFIGRRRLWFILSTVVVVSCIVLLATRGLNLGIEFVGGVQIQAPIAAEGPLGDAPGPEVVARVQQALEPLGAGDATVQVATDDEGGRTLSVQTEEVADPERQNQVISAVAETVGASDQDIDSSSIGERWGSEITGKAARALLIFLVVVVAYMSVRFEWKMAAAAMIALIHDLLITAGVYSAIGFEVTPASVIAILTILGYSLYDTVVVFDKVEEDTSVYAGSGRMTYQDSANLALNEVFMRSLNTSFMTILPVGALLFVGAGLLGADTLKDLALALFVGLLVGAYSSVFVATPALTVWKEKEPRFRNVREKVLRDRKQAATAAPASEGGEEAERTPVTVGSGPSSSSRPGGRPRAGSKKSKRRKRR
ncbi:MAG: protein translocase subunit SecF [Actinomycetota bacterium]